jgi:transcriptional regulator of met regulon
MINYLSKLREELLGKKNLMQKRDVTYCEVLVTNFIHAGHPLPQKEDAPRHIEKKTIFTF